MGDTSFGFSRGFRIRLKTVVLLKALGTYGVVKFAGLQGQFGNRRPWHARTGSWENGPAAIARKHFYHPSFSLLRLLVVTRPVSDGAVTITTGGRSPPIRCIGMGVWRARSNGARSTRTTGGSCLSTIPRGRNETGSASGKGTSDGDAVLPTTTQLQILPTTAQPSRKPLNRKRRIRLANNSPLVNRWPSAP